MCNPPESEIFTDPFLVYAISFLATLNTRKVLRGKGTDTQGQSDNTNSANNPRNTFFMVTNSGRGTGDLGFNSRAKVRTLSFS